jgi:hypothetical protein
MRHGLLPPGMIMLKARIIELVDSIPLKSKIYAEAKVADRGATVSAAEDVMINRRACALLDHSVKMRDMLRLGFGNSRGHQNCRPAKVV